MNKMMTEDGFEVAVGQEGHDYVVQISDDDPIRLSTKDWEKLLDLIGKTGGVN